MSDLEFANAVLDLFIDSIPGMGYDRSWWADKMSGYTNIVIRMMREKEEQGVPRAEYLESIRLEWVFIDRGEGLR
jgi:phage gp46-like protein